MSRSQSNPLSKTMGEADPGWGRLDTGHPLPPVLWLGLPFSGWGPTPVLSTLLWVGKGLQIQQLLPCCLSSCPLGFIPRYLPFTPQPKAMTESLPGQWHHSSGLSPASGGVHSDQWQSLKRPCQPMAALSGLCWASYVASTTPLTLLYACPLQRRVLGPKG